MEQRLVDTYTAADILGLSPGTVRDWVYRGLLTRAGYLPRKGRYGRPRLLLSRDEVEGIATQRQRLHDSVE